MHRRPRGTGVLATTAALRTSALSGYLAQDDVAEQLRRERRLRGRDGGRRHVVACCGSGTCWARGWRCWRCRAWLARSVAAPTEWLQTLIQTKTARLHNCCRRLQPKPTWSRLMPKLNRSPLNCCITAIPGPDRSPRTCHSLPCNWQLRSR